MKLAARWPILIGLALYISSAVVVGAWDTTEAERTVFHLILAFRIHCTQCSML